MIIAIALLIALCAVLLSFWGFFVVAIAICVVRGSWGLSLFLAVCADLLYGQPLVFLHPVALPFVCATLVAVVLRFFIAKEMRVATTQYL